MLIKTQKSGLHMVRGIHKPCEVVNMEGGSNALLNVAPGRQMPMTGGGVSFLPTC